MATATLHGGRGARHPGVGSRRKGRAQRGHEEVRGHEHARRRGDRDRPSVRERSGEGDQQRERGEHESRDRYRVAAEDRQAHHDGDVHHDDPRGTPTDRQPEADAEPSHDEREDRHEERQARVTEVTERGPHVRQADVDAIPPPAVLHLEEREDLSGVDPQVAEVQERPARREHGGDECSPRTAAPDGDDRAPCARGAEGDGGRADETRSGGGDARRQPSFVEQRDQAPDGQRKEERIRIGHRQDERRGQEREEYDRSVGGPFVAQADGEPPEPDGSDEPGGEGHPDPGDRGGDAGDRRCRADQQRVSGEERDAALCGDPDPRRNERRIPVPNDRQVPPTVPPAQDIADRRRGDQRDPRRGDERRDPRQQVDGDGEPPAAPRGPRRDVAGLGETEPPARPVAAGHPEPPFRHGSGERAEYRTGRGWAVTGGRSPPDPRRTSGGCSP